MNLSEIIKDAIVYPTNNIKALVIYLVLGFLVGLVAALTGLGGFLTGSFNFAAGIVVGIIGIIVIICLLLLMLGFSLDIVKFGINEKYDAPEIELARQISNGVKYIIVSIVYLIIPIIVTVIMSMLNQTLGIVVGVILSIIFSFALSMAICRLAETDDLGHALDIPGAFKDLQEIGIGKVVITLIVSAIVGFVIVFILTFILSAIVGIISADLIYTAVPIITPIFDAWLLFYSNRVMGLLYSNKWLQILLFFNKKGIKH